MTFRLRRSRSSFLPTVFAWALLAVACKLDLHGVPIHDHDAAQSDAGLDDAGLLDAGLDDAGSPPDGNSKDAAADGGAPCFQGDLSIVPADQQSGDTPDFAAITCVEGSVFIDTDEPYALSRLNRMSGRLWIGPSTVQVVLPALLEVDAVDARGADKLTRLEAPKLERVSGSFEVNAPQLAKLELGALRHVATLWFDLLGPGLHSLLLPALESADKLVVNPITASSNALQVIDLAHLNGGDISLAGPKLRTVKLPALTACENLYLGGAVLTTLSVSGLKTVTNQLTVEGGTLMLLDLSALEQVGNLTLSGLHMTQVKLDRFRSLEGPSNPLVSGNRLIVTKVSGLQTLSFPALTTSTEIEVSDTPDLTSLSLPIFSSKLTSLTLSRAPLLTEVNLGSLPALDTLIMEQLDSLQLFSSYSLGLAKTISVQSCPQLAGFGFSQLQALNELKLQHLPVLNRLDLGNVAALSNLTFLDTNTLQPELNIYAPALRAVTTLRVEESGMTALSLLHVAEFNDLTIDSDPALTQLDFPELRKIHNDAYVQHCHALTTCEVTRLNAQLTDGHVFSSDLAVCPTPP